MPPTTPKPKSPTTNKRAAVAPAPTVEKPKRAVISVPAPTLKPVDPPAPFIPNTTRHETALRQAVAAAGYELGFVSTAAFVDAIVRHALGPDAERVPGTARVEYKCFAAPEPGFVAVVQIAQIEGSGAAALLGDSAQRAVAQVGAGQSWFLVVDAWVLTPKSEIPQHRVFAIAENVSRGELVAYVPIAVSAISEEGALASAAIHILANDGKAPWFAESYQLGQLRQIDLIQGV